MSEVQMFNFNGNDVRIITVNDQPYFVAKDVADVLGYVLTTDMAKMIDDDDRTTHKVHTLGGPQSMIVITESGLYEAIFNSQKPEAKAFKKWVTSEVLPSIRKNGGYIKTNEADTPESILAKAVILAHNVIAENEAKILELQRTKSYISDKKVATVLGKLGGMTTAFNRVKAENVDLKIALDKSDDYMTIRAFEKKTGLKCNWRALRDKCEELGIERLDIPDPLYGSVKSYPKVVFEDLYEIEI